MGLAGLPGPFPASRCAASTSGAGSVTSKGQAAGQAGGQAGDRQQDRQGTGSSSAAHSQAGRYRVNGPGLLPLSWL